MCLKHWLSSRCPSSRICAAKVDQEDRGTAGPGLWLETQGLKLVFSARQTAESRSYPVLEDTQREECDQAGWSVLIISCILPNKRPPTEALTQKDPNRREEKIFRFPSCSSMERLARVRGHVSYSAFFQVFSCLFTGWHAFSLSGVTYTQFLTDSQQLAPSLLFPFPYSPSYAFQWALYDHCSRRAQYTIHKGRHMTLQLRRPCTCSSCPPVFHFRSLLIIFCSFSITNIVFIESLFICRRQIPALLIVIS